MRILLADDQLEVRSALRLLLEQEADLDIVGEAAEADDLVYQVLMANPDLLLLDWELAGNRTADLVARLHAIAPHLRIIALGRLEARRQAIRLGADAFVSKVEPPERLLMAVHSLRTPDHHCQANACAG